MTHLTRIYAALLLVLPLTVQGQWVQTSNGIGSDQIIASMASSNGWVYAGVLIPYGEPELDGVYRSSDNGLTWEEPDTSSIFEPMDLYATGSTVYGASNSGGFVYVSHNSAATFEVNDQGNTWSVGSVVPCGGNIISHFQYGIFQSIEAGPWDFINNPFENTSIRDMASNGETVVATFNSTVSQQGRVMTSTDCGSSWQEVLVSNNAQFNTLSMSGSTILAFNVNGMFISTDLGNEWNTITDIEGEYIESAVAYDGRIFATTYQGVFVSLDNGQSWIDITGGSDPTPLNFNAITIHDGYVFMGTSNNSVWRMSLADITSIVEQHSLQFALFPNPSTGEVQLQFPNGQELMSGYSIYTMDGQIVVEGNLAVNAQMAKVDVSCLTQGMYVLALQGAEGVIIGRKRFIKVN